MAAVRADNNIYYAERGHWSVATTGNVCRALNRPPFDFNTAPFNALEIVGRDHAIGVEVFFWPQAVDPTRAHRLALSFTNSNAITLDAKVEHGRLHACLRGRR